MLKIGVGVDGWPDLAHRLIATVYLRSQAIEEIKVDQRVGGRGGAPEFIILSTGSYS